jgi:uncharacterized protein (TIGR02453 family)
MQAKRIIQFLKDVAANNNREWFQAHKDEYDAIRADFEDAAAKAIVRIGTIDPTVAHLTVKDVTYRFYRDTRFSPDKSPYKNHLGAYISAHGKKALHGGYYFHIQPDNCMLAFGNYWLPTDILTSCRNKILAQTDHFRQCVESPEFKKYFDGFGLERLKTCPKGFPKDFPYMDYLRAKDYCCCRYVDDEFFEGDEWLDEFVKVSLAAKPMMDFMNEVIDDYE